MIHSNVMSQERLLREEAIYDTKSPKLLNLERDITTALKISLQARCTSDFSFAQHLTTMFSGIEGRE